MFDRWLHLIDFLLVTIVLALIVAIILGYIVSTETEIVYRIQDGATYPMLIRDADRAFNVTLVGTRCYHPLPIEPEWNATRHQYQPNYYPETLLVPVVQSSEAVNRIRCE